MFKWKNSFWHEWKKQLVGVFFLAWAVYFALFWSRALYFDTAGNLHAGHINIWGDWAVHFTIGSRLAYGSAWWPTTSPLLVGAPFLYPFVADWLSAGLVRIGWSFWSAFTIPSALGCFLAVAAVWWHYRVLFRSRAIAVIGSLLFFLNGGLGWIYFLSDVVTSDHPWVTFINPLHEYTRMDTVGIKWISIIDSMLIPQRAFTLGFPIAVILLTLLLKMMRAQKKLFDRQWFMRQVFFGGMLAVLPIIHTHSFISVVLILSLWVVGETIYLLVWQHQPIQETLIRLTKQWGIIAAISASSSLLLMLHFGFFQSRAHQLVWSPGWLAPSFDLNPVWFWLKNWGIMPVLGLVAWVKLGQVYKWDRRWFWWVPSWFLFVIANMWIFQPYDWDNTKFLVWASLGISGLVAWLLVYWWRDATHFQLYSGKKLLLIFLKTGTRCFLALLFFASIASGLLDAYWIQRIDLHNYTMYSSEELQLAEWVKQNTPPDSVWLTSDQHNHWLFNLTGRQAVMTYRGWMWTHGYNYRPVEADELKVFKGISTTPAILEKYGVEYIVLGPSEKGEFKANKTYLLNHYPPVYQTQSTSVLEVKE